jgi:hypothetical protein
MELDEQFLHYFFTGVPVIDVVTRKLEQAAPILLVECAKGCFIILMEHLYQFRITSVHGIGSIHIYCFYVRNIFCDDQGWKGQCGRRMTNNE